ncbi:MAG: hypothetical protein HY290_04215 [Planctomycetia bacterium]|nr:hypothetical protein [Planctomycetia bacterium]
MTAADFGPEFRNLIDARLDAIDQALLHAHVAYSERRSIVSEVETQIYELLSRRSENPAHDDVVAVLDSLDPPESYIPEELRDRVAGAIPTPVHPKTAWPQLPLHVVRIVSKFAVAAGCVLVLVVLNVVIVLIVASTNGVIPWVVTAAGIAWLNYAGLGWLRSKTGKAPGTIIRDLRNGLAALIAPKNGTTATEP